MEPQFDFKALTAEKEEKIIKNEYYIPGILIASVLPLLTSLIRTGEGFHPVLWSMSFAFVPAVFALMTMSLVRLSQKQSIHIKNVFKIPLFIFYLVFLSVGYQTLFTIQHNKEQFKHQNDKP